MTTTSVVRVTVAAPTRRIDLALPERAPVAEMLPGLLRRAGERDDPPDGGWILRRTDGTPVDAARTLAVQNVRDGEVLHLVPGSLDWPELAYDDLVDAIAGGAGRTGRLWQPRHTRLAGLAATVPAVLLVLLALLRAGPPWTTPGRAALLVAGALLLGGTVLARALGDAGAGAVLAALALPAAFVGGAVLIGGPVLSGPVLGGCVAVLVTAVLGALGVAHRLPVFVAAAVAGLLGGSAAAAVALGFTDAPGAAAVTAAAVFLFSPLLGPLAVRLGRIPMPTLPRTAADLLRDDPQPPRSAVNAAVLRADALLTGILSGGVLTAALAAAVLGARPGTAGVVLLGLLSLGFGIRARLYPAVRHRLPFLLAAAASLAALMAGLPLPIAGPALLALVAFCVSLAIVYSRHPAGAGLARYAEIAEMLLVLGCVPAVCAVLRLYGLVRGLGG